MKRRVKWFKPKLIAWDLKRDKNISYARLWNIRPTPVQIYVLLWFKLAPIG